MICSLPPTLCCDSSTLPSASLTSTHDGPVNRSLSSGAAATGSGVTGGSVGGVASLRGGAAGSGCGAGVGVAAAGTTTLGAGGRDALDTTFEAGRVANQPSIPSTTNKTTAPTITRLREVCSRAAARTGEYSRGRAIPSTTEVSG